MYTSIPRAKNFWTGQYDAARDDGRLPRDAHNTGVSVFGNDVAQARTVAEERAQKAACREVAWFGGSADAFPAALK